MLMKAPIVPKADKGKGIKYADEHIKRKAGKKVA